jgi:hypothetical protein
VNKVTIEIREDGYVTVEEDNGGIKTIKPISPDSLLDCIAMSLALDGVTSGLLPKGCISFATLENGSKRVCLVHRETYADVSYYKTPYPHFPLPRLVFGFTINNYGRVTACDMGITENTDFLKPTTAMYHYPLSNVSGFRLCTGNNVLPHGNQFLRNSRSKDWEDILSVQQTVKHDFR